MLYQDNKERMRTIRKSVLVYANDTAQYQAVNQYLSKFNKIKLSPSVIFHIPDRFKAVLLIWFSVFACFGVRFGIVFTFCVSR